MTTIDTGFATNSSILIVDDSLQYAAILTKILSQAFGFTTIKNVVSSEEALNLVTADPEAFKILFIDFRFPSGFTGGELLTKLKQQNLLKGKAAFLITSEPSSENVKLAVRDGAVGIVAKPFDRDGLKIQLQKAARILAESELESF